jgi:4-carboxymuconolactone decarboxylase
VDAIRKGETPKLVREDEQVVYDVVIELFRTKSLSQATYDRALAMLGDDILLELVTNCGRYTQAAIVVNCYEVPTPGDKHPMTETKVSGLGR